MEDEAKIVEREGGVEVFDQGDAHARHLIEREGNVAVVVAAVTKDGDSQCLAMLASPVNAEQRNFLLAFLAEVGRTLVNRAELLDGMEFDGDGEA